MNLELQEHFHQVLEQGRLGWMSMSGLQQSLGQLQWGRLWQLDQLVQGTTRHHWRHRWYSATTQYRDAMTYQGHVIHPSSMVRLKVMHFSDVINNTDHISSSEQLNLKEWKWTIKKERFLCSTSRQGVWLTFTTLSEFMVHTWLLGYRTRMSPVSSMDCTVPTSLSV